MTVKLFDNRLTKFVEAFGLSILIILISSERAQAMSCSTAMEQAFDPKLSRSIPASPSKEIIERKVFAVSALRTMPQSNMVAANSIDYDHFDKPYELPTLVRFGVHFSLGEMVRPHSGGNWDNRTVAMIKPLAELDGLININPYDTLALGDIRLTENTILVVPKGSQVSSAVCGCKIFEYEPSEINLRIAIDKAIHSEGGWTIRTKEDVNDQRDAEFEIGGQTYQTSSFFKEFLKDKPHVSIGNELRSLSGEGFRFGMISQILRRYMRSFSSMNNDFGQKYFNFQLHVIEHHVQRLLGSGVLERLSPMAKQNVLSVLQTVQGMLNIGRLDQYLRIKYSKTLVGSNLTPELWASRANLDVLKEAAEASTGFIPHLQKTDSEPSAPPQYYALLLSTLPVSERVQFVFEHPDLIPRSEESEIMGYVQKILEKDPH